MEYGLVIVDRCFKLALAVFIVYIFLFVLFIAIMIFPYTKGPVSGHMSAVSGHHYVSGQKYIEDSSKEQTKKVVQFKFD